MFFASASMDGTVRLWAGQTWACLRIFTAAAAHEHMPFLAAAMSLRCAPRCLAAASQLLWQPACVMRGRAGSPLRAPWHGRNLVAGSSDGQVRLWSCGELLAEAAGALQGCASPEASAANGKGHGAAPGKRLITWRHGLSACALARASRDAPGAQVPGSGCAPASRRGCWRTGSWSGSWSAL